MRRTIAALLLAAMSAPAGAADWLLVIHGGAGAMGRDTMPAGRDAKARAGLKAALDKGAAMLAKGASALDTVETVIRILEDDPGFNAGRGAVFSAAGTNELDASIMDGTTRKAGAVAGISRTRHPISAARAVMERTRHVLMIGEGAERIARDANLEQVDPSFFRTEERWREYQSWKAGQKVATIDGPSKWGTVGAVVRDARGHLAAGTSTGGYTGKLSGRVGDSPIIGAGTYADDRGCAVSATGTGEFFIRLAVAHEICARVRFAGDTPQAAADAVVGRELGELGGDGGVIVLGSGDAGGWRHNTPGMYRGKVGAKVPPTVAIYADEP